MTREEALYWLDTIPTIGEQVDALEMAIKALEQEHCENCISRKKDIPKSPVKNKTPRYGMGYAYYDWYCPNCGRFLAYEYDSKRQSIHHCKCGQNLDWSNEGSE